MPAYPYTAGQALGFALIHQAMSESSLTVEVLHNALLFSQAVHSIQAVPMDAMALAFCCQQISFLGLFVKCAFPYRFPACAGWRRQTDRGPAGAQYHHPALCGTDGGGGGPARAFRRKGRRLRIRWSGLLRLVAGCLCCGWASIRKGGVIVIAAFWDARLEHTS